jgi:hypothetical protein
VYYIQALPEAFWSFAQMIVPRITLIHSYEVKDACGGELRVYDGVVISYQTQGFTCQTNCKVDGRYFFSLFT